MPKQDASEMMMDILKKRVPDAEALVEKARHRLLAQEKAYRRRKRTGRRQ